MAVVPLVARIPVRVGSSGAAALELQNALRRFDAELVPDGNFGRITLLAAECGPGFEPVFPCRDQQDHGILPAVKNEPKR